MVNLTLLDDPTPPATRPFIKWAGSKQRLMSAILPYVPKEFGAYFEPFLGSGALFFAIAPSNAYLNDRSTDLIRTYEAVRDDPYAVMRYLTPLRPDQKLYYQIRAKRSLGRIKRAAEFIYLNKTCWNGLYRVNLKGEFNVPFGRFKGQNIFDKKNILHCSKFLRQPGVSIFNEDFESVACQARRGDFVYFDPPYVTRHNNNGFIEWNEDIFSWSDQIRLSRLATKLRRRGVHVLVSNADHQDVVSLYDCFKVVRISRKSTLASDVRKRTSTTEVLLLS